MLLASVLDGGPDAMRGTVAIAYAVAIFIVGFLSFPIAFVIASEIVAWRARTKKETPPSPKA